MSVCLRSRVSLLEIACGVVRTRTLQRILARVRFMPYKFTADIDERSWLNLRIDGSFSRQDDPVMSGKVCKLDDKFQCRVRYVDPPFSLYPYTVFKLQFFILKRSPWGKNIIIC